MNSYVKSKHILTRAGSINRVRMACAANKGKERERKLENWTGKKWRETERIGKSERERM